MKILNVNHTMDTLTGGGTAERTFQMSRFLALSSAKCTILTTVVGIDDYRVRALKPAVIVTIPVLWKRYHIPIIKWKVIKELVNEADVIHLMGHWSVLNAFVYYAARFAHKPYVVCPAGALPLFGRSLLFKYLYNVFIGNKIIRNASAWIAVTSAEFPQFGSYGIPASRVSVIPNGVSKEDFPSVDLDIFRRNKGLPGKPIILFVGRLNLIKGPDLLLQAFALVQDRIPDFQLVFAGPDEGMQSELVNLAVKEGIIDRIHFLGFVNGKDKSAAYQMASLLVVPSRQEAMSIVALEAMICGTPVLLTDQCGFSEIKTIHPSLEVAAEATEIAERLVLLLTDEILLKSVALLLKNFAMQKYSWDHVVLKFLHLYKIILKEK